MRRVRRAAALFAGFVLLPGGPSARAVQESPAMVSLMQSAAAAFRGGRLEEALSLMVRVLDREPDNAAAKNYVWTIARKMREEDARSPLSPRAKEAGVRLALKDLEERRRRARRALAELEEGHRRSRNLRSPADILAGLEGLERLLGEEFSSERDEAAAAAYFQDIVANLSKALKKNAFVARKDQYRAEGYLAYFRRDWKAATSRWEAALKEDPADSQVRKDLDSLRALVKRRETEAKVRDLVQQAQTYEDTGYPREAAESWEAVLKLDPRRPGAREKLAVARVAAEKGEMKEKLKRMTDEGLRLYREGDYVGGAQAWLEVLQKDPGHEQARRWLAQVGPKLRGQEPLPAAARERGAPVQAKTGPVAAPGAALSSSTKAMESYKQGIMYYTENKLKEALAAWTDALKHDPSMAKAQQAIRQVETELAFQQ